MVERLEMRRLLSGDVAVYLEGGWLHVRGDASDNALVIESVADDSASVIVRGEEGTTLNGAVDTLRFEGVAGGLRLLAHMGRGDDRLTIDGLDSAESAHLHMGYGEDETLVQESSLSGVFRFRDAAGRSISIFDTLEMLGPTSFASGDVADSLTIRDCDFRGAAKVATGGDHDFVRIRGTTFAQNVVIDEGEGDDGVKRELVFDWDFRQGAQGWVGGFADYVPLSPQFGGMEYYALRAGIEPVPAETGRAGTSFVMSGANRSDDLFMFLARRLSSADGLTAETPYTLSFEVRFASRTPAHVGGAGGSPSKGVFVKVGGAPRRLEVARNEEGKLQLSIDKGNQGSGRTEMSVAGDVDNGLPDADPNHGRVYTVVRRRHTHTHSVKTGRAGMLSIVVGTDSGFEGITTLYYTRIRITLSPVTD